MNVLIHLKPTAQQISEYHIRIVIVETAGSHCMASLPDSEIMHCDCLKLVTWLTALFKHCSSATQKFLYDLSSSFLLNGEAIFYWYTEYFCKFVFDFRLNFFRWDLKIWLIQPESCHRHLRQLVHINLLWLGLQIIWKFLPTLHHKIGKFLLFISVFDNLLAKHKIS